MNQGMRSDMAIQASPLKITHSVKLEKQYYYTNSISKRNNLVGILEKQKIIKEKKQKHGD